MTTLNLFNAATFYANTAYLSLGLTPTDVLSNSTGSNQLLKVNNLLMTNYSSSYVFANVSVSRSSTLYPIVGNMTIPPGATIVALGKDTPIPRQEGDALQCYANTAASVNLTAGYEFMG